MSRARRGWSVRLVAPPPQRADGRTVALMAGSVSFLQDIGAWDAVTPQASPLATSVDESSPLSSCEVLRGRVSKPAKPCTPAGIRQHPFVRADKVFARDLSLLEM